MVWWSASWSQLMICSLCPLSLGWFQWHWYPCCLVSFWRNHPISLLRSTVTRKGKGYTFLSCLLSFWHAIVFCVIMMPSWFVFLPIVKMEWQVQLFQRWLAWLVAPLTALRQRAVKCYSSWYLFKSRATDTFTDVLRSDVQLCGNEPVALYIVNERSYQEPVVFRLIFLELR